MIFTSTPRATIAPPNEPDGMWIGVRPDDPRPYRNTADNSRWPDDGYSHDLRDPVLLPFDPRREFRAPTNPILAAFRNCGWGGRLNAAARIWLDEIEQYHDSDALPEQIEHARKVLTRLSARITA